MQSTLSPWKIYQADTKMAIGTTNLVLLWFIRETDKKKYGIQDQPEKDKIPPLNLPILEKDTRDGMDGNINKVIITAATERIIETMKKSL